MLRILISTAVFMGAAAAAQVTSYKASNAERIEGDPDKIVCKKEETLGTRLGAKKVCLTVAEWQARAGEDRDQTQQVQAGARVCPDGGSACQ